MKIREFVMISLSESGKPTARSRVFAAVLMAIAVSTFALIVLRVCFYRFNYDPQYYPVDHGRFNFFSFFTVQSNLYVCFYLFCLSLACFGVERARRIAFHPVVRLTVTTYILVTGAVYCGGIPMKMTPPLYWTDFYNCLLSTVQIVHHVVMPVLVFVLFLITADRKTDRRKLPLVAVYPFVYSVFSIIRGALSDPEFYPYPFYRPEFFWNIFLKGHEMSLPAAYLLMLPMLIAGVSVFVLIAFVLALINDRLAEKRK